MTRFILLFVLFISCRNTLYPNVDLETHLFNSSIVKDEYIIQIKKPASYNVDSSYHILFVADGTIGLGEYGLGTNPEWKATSPKNSIIVTIGHKGDWQEKRRRDFIPSDAGGYSDENFGKAHLFYNFLKKELIPFINDKIPKVKDKSFIGHSFSGLFSLYAALQNENLFDNYFAISPSVWANYNELLKIESTTKDVSGNIFIYAGSLEIFNKVLSSTKEFHNNITKRRHKNLKVDFIIINGSNHSSVRKPAIDKIFAKFQE